MNQLAVREGQLDVVLVAGPRVRPWPTPGVRVLSALCSELGLSVGWLGGEAIFPRGVLPSPGTGGIVIAQDVQGRIHRIQARSVVKFAAREELPDPFPGWRSQGLIPLSTARRLLTEADLTWGPLTVVLGTSNRALRFASELLEKGASGGAAQVACVEPYAQWGAKRYAGWEVERRRFETLGGKLIEARPVGLEARGALQWRLRLADAEGVRILDVARVVSAGPFGETLGVREYPPGSLLFELEQTAAEKREEEIEGWFLEEERARQLGARIARALLGDLGERKAEWSRAQKRARARLRLGERHREEPFSPAYEGKWLSSASRATLRAFAGVPGPEAIAGEKALPSIECFEAIACNRCEKACPESAIRLGRLETRNEPDVADAKIAFAGKKDAEIVLGRANQNARMVDESLCTSCGLCLPACPSSAIVLLKEREGRSTSPLTLVWRGSTPWRAGELATLVNRRGESLGSARIAGVEGQMPQLVSVEAPSHLLWEARGLRRGRAARGQEQEDLPVGQAERRAPRVELTLDGEKRLLREKASVTAALFESGLARSGDALYCPDGSCGLCQLEVDGTRRPACQTQVRKGMAIRLPGEVSSDALCPCEDVTSEEVIERVEQGKLRSPEAVVAITGATRGRCHGQLCCEALRRALEKNGVAAREWVDWSFPWMDWVLRPSP